MSASTSYLQPPPRVLAKKMFGQELTDREEQVLWLMPGRSNLEIGRELRLKEDTVKTHARRLFAKLGARDRAHAVLIGAMKGIYDGVDVAPPPDPTPISERHLAYCASLRPNLCNCRRPGGAG